MVRCGPEVVNTPFGGALPGGGDGRVRRSGTGVAQGEQLERMHDAGAAPGAQEARADLHVAPRVAGDDQRCVRGGNRGELGRQHALGHVGLDQVVDAGRPAALLGIGQEVLVDFLGGDVDKPIIVGRVFTQLQPLPYKLPEHRTKTVICRTQTVGGDGYNEIVAEDAAGRQKLGFHAERDMEMVTKRDVQESVGENRTSTVGSTWKFDALPPAPAGGVGGTAAARSGLDWSHDKLDITVGSSKVVATHDTVTLRVGDASSIVITADKITINAPTVEINGQTLVDVHGGTIQLNC